LPASSRPGGASFETTCSSTWSRSPGLPKTEAAGGSALEESFPRLVDGWLDLATAVP
jgi:hypothetical protein